MSKKLTFHCVSGRNLLTVGLPHAQYHGAELEAVLTRLASYNRRGRLVSQVIYIKRSKQCLKN